MHTSHTAPMPVWMNLLLTDTIINDVNIGNSYIEAAPAKVSLQLYAFRNSPNINGSFNYHSTVGTLNYLCQTTSSDILYAVHQVAKESATLGLSIERQFYIYHQILEDHILHWPLHQTGCFYGLPILLQHGLCMKLEQRCCSLGVAG
jgi:hypothetical protein